MGLLILLVLCSATCETDDVGSPPPVPRIEEGPLFGSDSASPDDPTGGAVLGGIYDADVSADSLIYVLESDWKKIVVFARDGSLRRTIMGGYGEGPGEFVRAVGMDVTPDGHSYVLDSGLSRVSIFDPDGGFVRSVSTGTIPVRDIAVHGDTIFLRVLFGSGEHALQAVSADWEGYRPFLQTSERDRAFSRAGFSGAIASDVRGRVVYAFGSPGEFVVIDSNGASPRRGLPLFPDDEPVTVETAGGPQQRVTAGTLAVAIIQDALVAILYATYDIERADEIAHHVALYDWDGRFLGTLDFAERGARVMAGGAAANTFYLNRSLPFPALVGYTLRFATDGQNR
ncbi:MAG TPA: hypothetical protein VF039_03950 [Longimicrobiales bacterium]